MNNEIYRLSGAFGYCLKGKYQDQTDRGAKRFSDARDWVALHDEGAELSGVAQIQRVIGKQAMFVLKPEGRELPVLGAAEHDVARVVRVFDEGGEGIFAAKGG